MDALIICGEGLVVEKKKRRILDVPFFGLQQGERVGLVGKNGAGKSTLVQTLALLAVPDSGSVSFHGCRVQNSREMVRARRRMAVVFQEPLLLNATVFENVAAGLKLRRVPREQIRRRVNHWLAKMGIAFLAERFPYNLSGGEAQRVNLARSLVVDPEVLFMDEPLAYLDAPTKRELLSDIHPILKENPASVVWVTHDPNELPGLTSRLAVMDGAKIVQEGAPRQVLTHPNTTEMARFLGIENIWKACIETVADRLAQVRVDGGLLITAATGGLAVQSSSAVSVCVRAADIEIAKRPDFRAGAVPGKIKAATAHGLDFLVTMAYAETEIIALSREPYAAGEKVFISIPQSAVHIIP